MRNILKKCRFCGEDLKNSFCDLGETPLSNSYLAKENLKKKENVFPLQAYVCSKCLLVQLPEYETPENIFQDYAYFSSFSSFWLKHCENYVNMVIEQRNLSKSSFVVEIASNDGYLLQYFKKRNIPCLGIEPAKNVAEKALSLQIPTVTEFFGENLAQDLTKKYARPDLIIANNVLAHVPNLNDFVKGLKTLLGKKGIITIEVPHVLELIKNSQFDTIYHEHFSYFSLHTLDQIFKSHELFIYDLEKIDSHGGSLRIYVCHLEDSLEHSDRKERVLKEEIDLSLDKLEGYSFFQDQAEKIKKELLSFLFQCKKEGKKIVGYGAPAKGNTLLNFCGVKTDLLEFTVDISPYKQGKFLPGSLISIKSPEEIIKVKPDFVLILPWNLKEEISRQLKLIRQWGAKFVVPIPRLEVF